MGFRMNRISTVVKIFFLSVFLAGSVVSGTALAEAPESAAMASVNINTASAEELAEKLKGVGESKARLIVAYREANGSFGSVEQLTEVKGIGKSTIEKNKGRILL
ncbi:ComEA family DNA-binding protein [Biformimicrobium ophioploci]|uniref:ComEA family DNA-binding protein n=2 Tax=Biformimicrobium ophioploci TaxID=3036711 RepID=A0ABQ6M267_9GAMM|nr:ComEA family DNA-binding protein [Microbulbifer sp. NKW57]